MKSELTKEMMKEGSEYFRSTYMRNRLKICRIISIEDFEQECWEKCMKFSYDPERSVWKTFCFLVGMSVYNNLLRVNYAVSNANSSRYSRVVMKDDMCFLTATQDHSSVVSEEIASLLKEVKFGCGKVPASALVDCRRESRTLGEVSDYVFDQYGVRVTEECVRQWYTRLASVLRVNFCE
jgi:hypothetical protein